MTIDGCSYDGQGVLNPDGVYIQPRREHREGFGLTVEQFKLAQRKALELVWEKTRKPVGAPVVPREKLVKSSKDRERRRALNAKNYEKGNLLNVDDDFFESKMREKVLKTIDCGFKNLESVVNNCEDFHKLASGIAVLLKIKQDMAGNKASKKSQAIANALDMAGKQMERSEIIDLASQPPISSDIAKTLSKE
jgi:hypothetical protein